MKKELVFLMIAFVMLSITSSSIVFAEGNGQNEDSGSDSDEENDDSSGNRDEVEEENDIEDDSEDSLDDESENEVEIEIENELEDDGYVNKTKIKIRNGSEEIEIEEKIRVREENFGNETKIKVKLSNGNVSELKFLPEQASERAREILGERFQLEIREKVRNNVPTVVYHIESNKTGKFLGVFKMKYKLEGEIDPENGELISKNAPWWAGLVFGEDEDDSISPINETNASNISA